MFDARLLKGKFAKISHIAAVTFLFGFIFVSLFGMSLSMQVLGDGTMVACPSMGDTAALCNMAASEHVSIWQQLFSAIPEGKVLTVLAALLAARLFSLFLDRLVGVRGSLALSLWSYKQEHPDSKLFDYLIAFFARGILQPKIYNA
ncbi:MAG: hypothetical protein Q8N81_02740 [bacterium]|nr:hypothetical protein [bacterium]